MSHCVFSVNTDISFFIPKQGLHNWRKLLVNLVLRIKFIWVEATYMTHKIDISQALWVNEADVSKEEK